MKHAIGMVTIRRIDRVRKQCEDLGFALTSNPHNHSWDEITLVPATDALPVYSRDAQIFIGDLDSVEAFVRGIAWSRDYDSSHLRISTDKKRQQAEQDYRNRILVKTMKTGRKIKDPLRELK